MNETIAAISTAFGEAAISVLRLSGPEAVAVAGRVFSGRVRVEDAVPRMQNFGHVLDASGRRVDSVLLTVFKGPQSYTGEDVVEISGHGGILVTRRIFELLLEQGARAAGPGEFTQRAFLNGKMDLTQAEAVMDLIHAQSELALQAATQQLEGSIGNSAEAIREALIHLLAHVEAYIDFPDEDIDPDTGASLVQRMESLEADLSSLLATAEHGRILRSGARTVICGEPNVGKSSLLNLLSGFDRAIVSPTAGTTRDTIEEVLHIHGLPFCLIDTAGLRESADEIERSGMSRTTHELERADVILEVVDGSRPPSEAQRVALSQGTRGHLLVLNKSDLGVDAGWADVTAIRLSCEAGSGVDDLRDAMRDAVWSGAGADKTQLVAINARHQQCFTTASAAIRQAKETLLAGSAPEYVSLELREALQSVGEVTGRVDVEEILGAIFSSFCIGK